MSTQNDNQAFMAAMEANSKATEALTLIKQHIIVCAAQNRTIIGLLGWGGGLMVAMLIGSLSYFLMRFGLPGSTH